MADQLPIGDGAREPEERAGSHGDPHGGLHADPHGVLHGGTGGFAFDDALATGDRIGAVWLAAGTVVDSVQIAYRNGHRTSRHGGYGGGGGWTELEPDELVLALSGRYAEHVLGLALHTTRRVIAAGRADGGTGFHLAAPPGHHLIGLRGRCGWYLDAVGPLWGELPPPRPPAWAPAGPAARVTFTPFSERRSG